MEMTNVHKSFIVQDQEFTMSAFQMIMIIRLAKSLNALINFSIKIISMVKPVKKSWNGPLKFQRMSVLGLEKNKKLDIGLNITMMVMKLMKLG